MVGWLGKLIVHRRQELGFSQQELARRIGVPKSNLSLLEHSPSRWRSRLLATLAAELQLPQLELALAAGIITDLPPLPASTTAGVTGSDGLTVDQHQLEFDPPNGGPSALAELLGDLHPADSAFLAVLAEQLIVRRQAPPAATGDDRADVPPASSDPRR